MPVDTDQIYAEVNARVLAALAKGVAPWTKPWGSGTGLGSQPRNLQSGKAYRGINAFLLSPFVSGYQDPRWTTANAALKVGAKIPKGPQDDTSHALEAAPRAGQRQPRPDKSHRDSALLPGVQCDTADLAGGQAARTGRD